MKSLKRLNKDKLYPKLLVTLQFGSFFVMAYFARGFFGSPLAVGIFLAGVILGLWAIKHNSLDNFNIQPVLKQNAKLITTGAYRYIRHPMYLSVILMAFGLLLANLSFLQFVLFVILVIVLFLKAIREERLWQECSIEYCEYKKRTKLIIPFIL